MTKEEKKELMDTVKIIKKGDPLWEAMEDIKKVKKKKN